MITRTLVAALLATASLVVAGCGADKETPASSSSNKGMSSADKKALLEFAQCMRDHGVNMPDPTFSDGGARVTMREDKGADPQKQQDAQKACQKYQDKVKPKSMSADEQKKQKEAALKNAQCMRDHGIDFPDPQFGEDGRMTQRIGGPNSNVDPNSQKFQDAAKACQKEGGGGMMFGGPDDGDGK
jgi:hypothetical protein